MTISVTNIGTNTSTTSTCSITVPVGGVPSGALICVLVTDRATGTNITGAAFSDTSSNTYNIAGQIQVAGTNGITAISYVKNCSALVSGNSITYTGSTSNIALSAFYATGIDISNPLDTAVTATNAGTSAAPSVTSGTSSGSGELFVGGIASHGTAGTITQDTTNGWAVPFTNVSSGGTAPDREVGGGNQVVPSTTSKTYAPTLAASTDWAIIVVAFKPLANTPNTDTFLYDWPNPRGYVPGIILRTETTNTAVANTLLNVIYATPFNMSDWPVPKAPGRLREYPYNNPGVDELTTIIHLDQFYGPAGMGPPNYDWPVPKGPPQLSYINRGMQDNELLKLITEAVLHNQYDWPNPRGAKYPKDLRTFIQGLNQPIFNNTQFFYAQGEAPRYDYPNPRGKPYPHTLYSEVLRAILSSAPPYSFGLILG